MQIQSFNQISFQKNLVANCKILNRGKQEACQIFELDKKVDWDYFKTLLTAKGWKEQCFVDYVDGDFSHPASDNYRYFALENLKGERFGFCRIDQSEPKCDKLDIIETMPRAACANLSRKRKYIGETMMAFLVKQAKMTGKESFAVPIPIADALEFYTKKCGFEKDCNSGVNMMADKFDEFINLNEKHTNSVLDIVG